jgi:hypothetical protein
MRSGLKPGPPWATIHVQANVAGRAGGARNEEKG